MSKRVITIKTFNLDRFIALKTLFSYSKMVHLTKIVTKFTLKAYIQLAPRVTTIKTFNLDHFIALKTLFSYSKMVQLKKMRLNQYKRLYKICLKGSLL